MLLGVPPPRSGIGVSIGSFGPECSVFDMTRFGTMAYQTTLLTANAVIYMPVVIDRPVTIYRMGWLNGMAVAGNVDVGIYDIVGTRLVSTGSTAASGTYVLQGVDVTDTPLGPGTFYLAAVASSGDQFFTGCAASTMPFPMCYGLKGQTSTFPLPATATFGNPSNNVVTAYAFTRP